MGGALATQITGRPFVIDDAAVGISREALVYVPLALAQRFNILAYRVEGGDLHVLVPDAADDDVLDRIRNISGMRVLAQEASVHVLRTRIASAYAIEEP